MKDIVSIDVETTGLNYKDDYIIQLAAIKFDRESYSIKDERNWYINPIHNFNISPQVYEKHGLSKDFILKNGQSLKAVGKEFIDFIKECDILTYNGNSFDIKFLYKDLEIVGIDFDLSQYEFYDSYSLDVKFNPRTLDNLYNKLTGKVLESAHNALTDARATIEVFKQQNIIYNTDIESSNIISPEGSIRDTSSGDEPENYVFSVGKYRDSEFLEVYRKDPQYVKWFIQNVASEYTRESLRKYFISKTKK